MMRKTLLILAALIGLAPAAAQSQQWPQTLPANTVIGRLGTEVVQLLLQRGADAAAPDGDGRAPADCAAEPRVRELLSKAAKAAKARSAAPAENTAKR